MEVRPKPLELTRDSIRDGFLRDAACQLVRQGLLSPEALTQSIQATLAARPPLFGSTENDAGNEVWVFGYGSLIWNPAFHFEAQQPARVIGWHRRFCLWTSLGRGTVDQPGLVLGLERGGSCTGIVYRVAREHLETELEIIWQREMIGGAYCPRWISARTDDGRVVPAITFTINRGHHGYAGRLADERVAEVLATACGALGPCTDYLFKTVAALEAHNFADPSLQNLKHRVERLLALRSTSLSPIHGEAPGTVPVA